MPVRQNQKYYYKITDYIKNWLLLPNVANAVNTTAYTIQISNCHDSHLRSFLHSRLVEDIINFVPDKLPETEATLTICLLEVFTKTLRTVIQTKTFGNKKCNKQQWQYSCLRNSNMFLHPNTQNLVGVHVFPYLEAVQWMSERHDSCPECRALRQQWHNLPSFQLHKQTMTKICKKHIK